MTIDKLKILAEELVKRSLSKGADTAQIIIKDKEEFDVTVRNSVIETLIQAESNSLLVILSKNKRKSSFSSSDLKEENIENILNNAIELLDYTEMDEYFSLPESNDLSSGATDIQVFDEEYFNLSAAKKIEDAVQLEKYAIQEHPSIITEASNISSKKVCKVIANSLGFCQGYEKTMFSASLSLVADDFTEGENSGRKQNDGWYSVKTHISDLDSLQSISKTAVERTIQKLGAKKPATMSVPVIFEKNSAADFIGGLVGAVMGTNIYRRQSFLADCLNNKIGSDLFTLIDDPLMERQIGSRPFDSEGVKSRKVEIFKNGVLKNFLYDTYSANKLGAKSTGAFNGISNLYLENGKYPLEELISGINEGILITSMFGQGANIINGGYSRGAQGIRIQNGKLSHPVNEFTIASTFADILNNITMIGNDLSFNGTVNSPSIKVEKLTISGI